MAELAADVSAVAKGVRIAIITDENVAAYYLEDCKRALEEKGYRVSNHIIPPGEESKNGQVYFSLMEELASVPLTRQDAVLALGGGVVGDLAGFVAATYMRGIDIIQVPTSLLAMVDSSIGGKTGIDLQGGKNLAGAFHMPILTYRDPAFLETLPESDLREGLAEVVKYGVIADEELFSKIEYMVSIGDFSQAATSNAMAEIIERCAEIKIAIVKKDILDNGERQLLNFGHTIGHAIEKLSNYSISHGAAVAKGMVAMTKIALRQGWCDEESLNRLKNLLEACGFDLTVVYPRNDIFETIKRDKKRRGSKLTLVIPRRIGVCTLKDVTINEGN